MINMTNQIATQIASTVNMGGFSDAAISNIEEAGVDIRSDMVRLIAGDIDAGALLEECLDGADDDRVEGWRDYVDTLKANVETALHTDGRFSL